ncbi:MAG: phosphoribosyltransferase family protein [Sodalis sp. (in: enterobacteria)]
MCRVGVAGKRVALVDDVVTTGSTAGEISRLLLRHHAREVQLWSICRTL